MGFFAFVFICFWMIGSILLIACGVSAPEGIKARIVLGILGVTCFCSSILWMSLFKYLAFIA